MALCGATQSCVWLAGCMASLEIKMDGWTAEAGGGYHRITERRTSSGPPQDYLQMVNRNLLREFELQEIESSGEVEKDNLQVYLRVRPFTASETGQGEQGMTVEGLDTVIVNAPAPTNQHRVEKRFTFSKVFGPDCSQVQMFEGTAQHLVRDTIAGRNSLLFTYGVTNSGKTYTFNGPESDPGLLPRSLALIFSSIKGQVCTQNTVMPLRYREFTRLNLKQQAQEDKAKNLLLSLVKEQGSGMSSLTCASTVCEGNSVASAAVDECKFSVWVSYFEIYTENIYDLLEQLPGGTRKRTVLQLSQDQQGHSFVKALRWVQVNTSEEAYRVMKVGKRNQSISATRLNLMSSRSHSIFSIRILRIGSGLVHSSELSLCDLAGSERSAQTQAGGQRLKEAGNINKSLLTLGMCMKALRLNQQNKNQQHVPFRESKLTRYIQAYFTGGGRACMLVNASPCVNNETVNVLKFSAIAQKVVPLRPLQGVMLRPIEPSVAAQRASREVSMRIDNAGRRDTIAWENSICLEDVSGDSSCLEDDEEEEEQSVKEVQQTDAVSVNAFVLEAKIRAEVVAEFEEILHQREKDYRQQFERQAAEMAELRAELKRLRIEVTNQNCMVCAAAATQAAAAAAAAAAAMQAAAAEAAAAAAAAGGEKEEGGRKRCAKGPARTRGRVGAMRPRRNTLQHVHYKEPSLSSKLRPGDRGTSTFENKETN